MSPKTITKTENLNAELAIIGGGGAGLSSALAASENGVKNIIVLDKRGTGGNSAMAFGIFAADSPVQKRNNINCTSDECFKIAMNWSQWRINPCIIRALIDKSGDTVKWLEDKGLEFECGPFFPNQLPTFHIPRGRGAKLMKTLAEECRELGIILLIRAPVTQITTDERGYILGVNAETSEAGLRIRCKAVIIATGGFGGNEEMLRQYCPEYHGGMERVGLPHMGDGIRMAAQIGAAIDSRNVLLLGGPSSLHPPDLHVKPGIKLDLSVIGLMPIAWEPRALWLNSKGKRFADESVDSGSYPTTNPVVHQPDNVCYTILDSSIVELISEQGPVMSMGTSKETGSKKLPGLADDLKARVKNGLVSTFGSLDEMAGWMQFDPGIIKDTLEEYNSSCDAGHDRLFLKDKKYLFPLRSAPYFVIRWQTAFTNTIGGIKVNENMEVMDNQGKGIPGLYAAGVDTSGWESETYCIRLPGHAFGFAINSGRIAGENAARYLAGT